MTQLFDTDTYEDANELVQLDGIATSTDRPARHLRSMPTGGDFADRTTQWRLDSATIETGRKGIEAARIALQAAARDSANPKRAHKAA